MNLFVENDEITAIEMEAGSIIPVRTTAYIVELTNEQSYVYNNPFLHNMLLQTDENLSI